MATKQNTNQLCQFYRKCSILSIFLRPIFIQIIQYSTFWEICIIFRTWKHQHSQVCKFVTDERSLSEKTLENFKQQDSIFGLKQQYLGIQRTMSNRALTEAEANNWNDKISFIFLKYTVAAMAQM